MKKATLSGLLLVTLLLLGGQGRLAAQDDDGRAAVVVRSGEGEVQTACVSFSGESISSYEALQRTDLALQTSVQIGGGLVCQIGDTGCPADDCWCQCKGGGDCVYWSFWHQLDGQWQYSQIGATSYQVADGTVEGWSWGPGTVNEAIEPPLLSFDEICQSEEVALAVTNSETPAAASTVAEPAAESTVDGDSGLLSYAFFGMLLVLLAGGLLLARKREGA